MSESGEGAHRGYDGGRTTGFASPAGDAIEGPVDLSEVLDLRRPHRYPVRVTGDALVRRGIHHGDILVVDAAAPPRHGCVVVAMVRGDVLVCEIALRRGQWWLTPATPATALPVVAEDDIEVWAVVAALVRTEI